MSAVGLCSLLYASWPNKGNTPLCANVDLTVRRWFESRAAASDSVPCFNDSTISILIYPGRM